MTRHALRVRRTHPNRRLRRPPELAEIIVVGTAVGVATDVLSVSLRGAVERLEGIIGSAR